MKERPSAPARRASITSRHTAVACAALFVAWALYAKMVIKDFSGPLIGGDDTNLYEFFGHHLAGAYRFGLPPDLGLFTNDVGYWQGTSIAYLPWCAERDLLHALLLRLFGVGPWLQLYCAISPGIGAFGTFFLLRREVGVLRAALAAFAGTFMAFYAAYKFPMHINLVPMHWGVLCIACDYVIARRVAKDAPIEAQLLLARVALMVLLIGIDLPYLAGYPITIFTLTVLFALVRWLRVARPRGVSLSAYFPPTPLADLRRTPVFTAACVLGIAVGLVLYVPFAFALVRAASALKFADAGGNYWASWPRILLPFLPGAHPTSPWVVAIFGDVEGIAEYCVGWTLLAVAALGIRCAVKRRALFAILPLLVAFVLFFSFHPKRFPILHIFPWFAFDRVAGRATAYFPLIFALVGLSWQPHPTTLARRAAWALAALGAVETVTAYTLVHPYTPVRLSRAEWAYFETVERAPGEALLEWPLCFAGGNGLGKETCPYYAWTSTAYTYWRFHHKKVMSFYPSRLHPSQLAPRLYLAQLFSPDSPDHYRADHETRCFDDAKWALFDGIYRGHDFAGIQLYVDRLPPECVAEFHARYGEPTATSFLPGPGRTEFLPRR